MQNMWDALASQPAPGPRAGASSPSSGLPGHTGGAREKLSWLERMNVKLDALLDIDLDDTHSLLFQTSAMVEDSVTTVGSSMRRLCSDFVRELLVPPYPEDDTLGPALQPPVCRGPALNNIPGEKGKVPKGLAASAGAAAKGEGVPVRGGAGPGASKAVRRKKEGVVTASGTAPVEDALATSGRDTDPRLSQIPGVKGDPATSRQGRRLPANVSASAEPRAHGPSTGPAAFSGPGEASAPGAPFPETACAVKQEQAHPADDSSRGAPLRPGTQIRAQPQAAQAEPTHPASVVHVRAGQGSDSTWGERQQGQCLVLAPLAESSAAPSPHEPASLTPPGAAPAESLQKVAGPLTAEAAATPCPGGGVCGAGGLVQSATDGEGNQVREIVAPGPAQDSGDAPLAVAVLTLGEPAQLCLPVPAAAADPDTPPAASHKRPHETAGAEVAALVGPGGALDSSGSPRRSSSSPPLCLGVPWGASLPGARSGLQGGMLQSSAAAAEAPAHELSHGSALLPGPEDREALGEAGSRAQGLPPRPECGPLETGAEGQGETPGEEEVEEEAIPDILEVEASGENASTTAGSGMSHGAGSEAAPWAQGPAISLLPVPAQSLQQDHRVTLTSPVLSPPRGTVSLSPGGKRRFWEKVRAKVGLRKGHGLGEGEVAGTGFSGLGVEAVGGETMPVTADGAEWEWELVSP